MRASSNPGGGNSANNRFLPRRPRQAPEPVLGADQLASEAQLTLHCEKPHLPADSTTPREGLWLPDVSCTHALPDGSLALMPTRGLTLPVSVHAPNLLIVGGAGAGKTYRVMLPAFDAIARSGSPAVIVNTKGPPFTKRLSAVARQYGRSITLLSLTDPQRSVGWNPITGRADLDSARDFAHTFCESIETDRASPESPYWINTAIDVFTQIIALINRADPEHANLAMLRQAIRESDFDAIIDAGRQHGIDVTRLQTFQRFSNSESHNALTNLADMAMRSAVLDSEPLSRVLGSNEFQLQQFVESGGILVLEIDEQRVAPLRQISAVFVKILLDQLIASANNRASGRFDPGFFLLLCELPALGRIPELGRYLNTVRERGVRVLADLQSLGQLHARYRNDAAEVLAGFQSLIALPGGLDEASASYVSQRSGTMTVLVPHITEERGDPTSELIATTRITYSPQSRAVLLPSEISRPRQHPGLGNPATVMPGDGTPPFYAYFPLAYDSPDLAPIIKHADEAHDPHLRITPLPTPQSQLNTQGPNSATTPPKPSETPTPPKRTPDVPQIIETEFDPVPPSPTPLSPDSNANPTRQVAGKKRRSPSDPHMLLAREILRTRFRLRSAPGDVKQWWTKTIRLHNRQPRDLLTALEHMIQDSITLEQVIQATRNSQAQHLTSALHYARYANYCKLHNAAPTSTRRRSKGGPIPLPPPPPINNESHPSRQSIDQPKRPPKVEPDCPDDPINPSHTNPLPEESSDSDTNVRSSSS